jgi:pyruvate kinase
MQMIRPAPFMPREQLTALLQVIRELKTLALKSERRHHKWLEKVHPSSRESARNLLHYLAIRTVDLRLVQERLSSLAISSLTHSEGYTFHNLERIEHLLEALTGEKKFDYPGKDNGLKQSRRLLHQHTNALFGKTELQGHTRLMVTLPSEAAGDPYMVRTLVQDGMQVARINTAHDDQHAWEKMIRNIHKASTDTGKKVLVYMDLAGPKIRTGKVLQIPGKNHGQRAKAVSLRKGSRIYFTGPANNKTAGDYPVMSISLPVLFRFVQKGDPISLDDGKFSGRVLEADKLGMLVEIHHAPAKKPLLKPEKGINLPETDMRIPSLSKEDLANLPFMVKHADMIGFSFVREVRDITRLQKIINGLGRKGTAIILKIENRRAFENLPRMMLAVMRQPKSGIMIARGDLAVEVGFLRIAEVQEEILWLAEAAHMPVIWATEILDNLVKKGRTTRAEISDAVKSVRAECVMLNKGPFVSEGLRMLRDIDIRMAAHENKKMKTLRSLHVAFNFLKQGGS